MRDYLNEMLYALTSAYTHTDHDNRRLGSPVETNIGKLFSVYAWGLGLVHEQSDLIKLWDNLDYACGTVLDRYGTNFGVQRYGSNDTYYRIAIKVKVLSQLSGGDVNTVLNAAAELLGVDMPKVLLEENFPAKIALYVDQDLLDEERLDMIEPIAWAIKRILAAGVGMRLYMRTYHTYRYNLPFSCATTVQTCFEPAPIVGEDRISRMPVSVVHSNHVMSALNGKPPDVKRASVGRRGGVWGAFTRTRIKPKRID